MLKDRGGSWRLLQLILVSAGAALTACGGAGTTPTPAPAPDASRPVLSAPIVDLALLFDFLPFGATSNNPTYKLYTNGDTASVRAAGPGTVVNVLVNPAGAVPTPDPDWEIHVRSPSAPDYLIIYDHLVALQVVLGQSVTPGQVLGRIATWSPGKGLIELQVNRGSGASTVALCPRQFGTADFNAAHDAALARFPTRGATTCVTDSVVP